MSFVGVIVLEHRATPANALSPNDVVPAMYATSPRNSPETYAPPPPLPPPTFSPRVSRASSATSSVPALRAEAGLLKMPGEGGGEGETLGSCPVPRTQDGGKRLAAAAATGAAEGGGGEGRGRERERERDLH